MCYCNDSFTKAINLELKNLVMNVCLGPLSDYLHLIQQRIKKPKRYSSINVYSLQIRKSIDEVPSKG